MRESKERRRKTTLFRFETSHKLIWIALFAIPLACGDPAGAPCATTGSGFHAKTNCRNRCLSRWQITCPNGERIAPNVCTGSFGCSPEECPGNQVCYADDDPFDDRSFCVVDTVCGKLSRDVLESWEIDRLAIQEGVKAARAEKEARREKWRKENPDAGSIAKPADRHP